MVSQMKYAGFGPTLLVQVQNGNNLIKSLCKAHNLDS